MSETTTTTDHTAHLFRRADGSPRILCGCGRTFTLRGHTRHAEATDAAWRQIHDVHTLTVFNAVDVPQRVQRAVLELLRAYSPDIYERPADATGRAL